MFSRLFDTSPRLVSIDWTRPWAHEFNLSGNWLRFETPPHSSEFLPLTRFAVERNIYGPTDPGYESRDAEGRIYRSYPCLKMAWDFLYRQGILRSVSGTEVSLDVQVLHNRHVGNLFNPERFQALILDEIDTQYGPSHAEGRHGREVRSPVDWTVESHYGVNWLRYFTQNVFRPAAGEYLWRAPVTAEHHVVFFFYTAGCDLELGACEELQRFMARVMSSVKIEYAPEMVREQDAARREAPDASYSPHREPFAWPEFDEDPDRFLTDSQKANIERERLWAEANRLAYIDIHGHEPPENQER